MEFLLKFLKIFLPIYLILIYSSIFSFLEENFAHSLSSVRTRAGPLSVPITSFSTASHLPVCSGFLLIPPQNRLFLNTFMPSFIILKYCLLFGELLEFQVSLIVPSILINSYFLGIFNYLFIIKNIFLFLCVGTHRVIGG